MATADGFGGQKPSMLWTKFSAVVRAAMAAALIAAPATVVTAAPAGGPPPVGCRAASLEGSGEKSNEHQSYVPTRCRDSFCCGNRFQSCSCKRRPARPAGPAPAGHDEELLSGRPIWLWQIGRVRWRQIFRRLILAPMDDSLPNRPSVLLRLCGRRRTNTGSATAWRLRG